MAGRTRRHTPGGAAHRGIWRAYTAGMVWGARGGEFANSPKVGIADAIRGPQTGAAYHPECMSRGSHRTYLRERTIFIIAVFRAELRVLSRYPMRACAAQ